MEKPTKDNVHVSDIRFTPTDWLTPIPINKIFPKGGPLEVDVGSGKGRFLITRAKNNPQTNFLGIERMLCRIRSVGKKIQKAQLENVRLIRVEAYYAVAYLIPPTSVRCYYIFFPDPWPKKRHHSHRLFDKKFIDALHRTLEPNGCLHFATDHQPYFAEVIEAIASDNRFQKIATFEPEEAERTDFEQYYLGKVDIGRCSFRKKP